MILKYTAWCRYLGKVTQEKVVGFYTCLSSHEEAERFRRRFHVSNRTSNKYTI